MQKSILGNTFDKVDNADIQEDVLGTKLGSRDNLESVYVFFSVNLVDSTVFKTRFIFRLCKYVEKNEVIISPNLVALLSVQFADKKLGNI